MKKVRFETPKKSLNIMHDSECHSPRPYIEREPRTCPAEFVGAYPRLLTYNSDPIQRYENGNSSPYPVIKRTSVPSFSEKELCWKPSDDLNLSLLDSSNHEPRQSAICKSILKETNQNKICGIQMVTAAGSLQKTSAVSTNHSKLDNPPNVLVKDSSFFIKRDNIDKYHVNANPIQSHLSRLHIDKENNPLSRKAEIMQNATSNHPPHPTNLMCLTPVAVSPTVNDECRCHHCTQTMVHNQNQPVKYYIPNERQVQHNHTHETFRHNCMCLRPRDKSCSHCDHMLHPLVQENVYENCSTGISSATPQNAVDRKTWAIEKYEKSKQPDSMEVEKQTNVSKEKREPTVADLFKIIKLQNEQLQLLQEKVDKFMSSSRQVQPTVTCSTEHVAINTVENEQHKMSIGVMTSFEMIRTSTVINKEVVQQTNENAQTQANRSQISIKEALSKPVNMNFLDGIIPKTAAQIEVWDEQNKVNNGQQPQNMCDEKTLNELSLYNVQVDNATTPLMSPEQTLYLDVRDYSDSEASNDQSNVGWTYYNKVMTHVNGMLQDSEMPSSASAMYRNMRQQCVHMQIDKTNVSVTKRVKFGDDPLGLHQPHIYAAPSSDTSLKMNQLAAKYLNIPTQVVQRPVSNPTTAPIDMSFATRNYMEKHRLLPGLPGPSKSHLSSDIPRFLDITALKQQPKFL